VCYGLSHVPSLRVPVPEAACHGPPEYAGNVGRPALMAFAPDRLGKAVKRAVRDPRRMAREAWSRKVETLFLLTALVPGPVRGTAGRPIAYIAHRLAARGTRPDISPQVAYIALWATGRRDAAEELARRIGTSSRATPRARRELAQLALSCGLRAAAASILESVPDDHTPRAEQLRARIDREEGRYTQALGHALAAAEGGDRNADRAVARIRAGLAVLEPEWSPDLGEAGVRLARLRGSATRGRILHLAFASLPYHHSGYSVRSQSVAKCQRAVGLDPVFATRAGFPCNIGVAGAPREELVDGVRYYRLAPDFQEDGFRDRLIAETARAAVPLIERLRPAAIQPASNHVQAQIALAVAGPAGIPVVYEVRGFWEETWASHPWHDQQEAMQTDHYRLTRATETRAMLASNAVVTLSETMRQAIIERGCPPERVVVIPNAVDADQFTPLARDEALARSLGIQPDEPVIGCISSLNPYEGMRYLLEAAATLRSERRAVRVLLVGDGKDMDALVETGQRLGLDDGTLIMTGRVPHDDVVRYYSIIDVFVVPRTASRVSQLVTPLKPYEAMAMERTVVVSDLPALREMVSPGETGMLFRAEDSADLADVLRGLLDDPALRLRLGRQGREWVLANRTWAANGRLYRELYERLDVA
jgi:glycosyltransferase involved in cell wall biosynthesis